MYYDTSKNNHGLPYNPFKALTVPRPIGWISTVSKNGIGNLSPYSYFNGLSYDPPFVMFSAGNRADGSKKDSVLCKWYKHQLAGGFKPPRNPKKPGS